MSPRIEGHASVAITATRGLPVPTKPVGYAKRTPVRSGHVPIKCGTAEGYERHRELGYRPCLMCIKAVESKPAQTPTRQPQQRAECGTVGGYSRHVKKGETTCDPCKEAQRAYRAKMRADKRAAEGKTKRAPFPIAKMLDLHARGLVNKDICEALGVTLPALRWHMKNRGLKANVPVAKCGTWNGYKRHMRHSEEACEPCKQAARHSAKEAYARRKQAAA